MEHFYLREARYAIRDAKDALSNAQDSLKEAIYQIVPDDLMGEERTRYFADQPEIKQLYDKIWEIHTQIDAIDIQVDGLWTPKLLADLRVQDAEYREMEGH